MGRLFLVQSTVNIPPYDSMVIYAENEKQAIEMALLHYHISSETIKSCQALEEIP